MNDSDLKSCPFCGSQVQLSDRDMVGSLRGFYWVIGCTECPAEMQLTNQELDMLKKYWNSRSK